MVHRRRASWTAHIAVLSLAAVLCGCDSHKPAASHGGADGRQDTAHVTEIGAEAEKLCAPFRALSPPASDKPDAATAATLTKCDTESLLYGIGTPKDVVRARQCAYVEAASDDSLGGVAALMTIYANGWGVKRDLDLARHFACAVDAAPAETEFRFKHFAKLQANGPDATPFDTCNDVTSGMWQGICNARDERIKDLARDRAIDEALSGWSESERAAYKRFAVVEDMYIGAQGGEVDASGSARAVEWQEAERVIRDRALATLRRLDRDDGFSATSEQRATSDQQLNLAYQGVMKADADTWEGMGTVKPEDVRTAQRAWIKYRDAWLALATAKGRTAAFANGLAVALTDQRAHDLRCLVDGANPGEKCGTEEDTSAQ
jgi:uncharacterized protein YecT (DUF1311 family)